MSMHSPSESGRVTQSCAELLVSAARRPPEASNTATKKQLFSINVRGVFKVAAGSVNDFTRSPSQGGAVSSAGRSMYTFACWPTYGLVCGRATPGNLTVRNHNLTQSLPALLFQ